MRLLEDLLRLVLEYLVAGIASYVTSIAIPFGIQSFQLAGLALFRFGQQIVLEAETTPTSSSNVAPA